MADFHENCIEWVTGDDRITVTLTQGRMINRVKALAEKHPDEIDYIINKDGSLFGHLPLGFLKLISPRTYSDEERAAMAETFKNRLENHRDGQG